MYLSDSLCMTSAFNDENMKMHKKLGSFSSGIPLVQFVVDFWCNFFWKRVTLNSPVN